jgi:hypothetical protein
LTKEEVEKVGFRYAEFEEIKQIYDAETLKDGWNTRMDENGVEEEFYYISISNPALGLWATPSKFEDDSRSSTKIQSFDTTVGNNNQKASDKSGGVGGWKHPPRNQI